MAKSGGDWGSNLLRPTGDRQAFWSSMSPAAFILSFGDHLLRLVIGEFSTLLLIYFRMMSKSSLSTFKRWPRYRALSKFKATLPRYGSRVSWDWRLHINRDAYLIKLNFPCADKYRGRNYWSFQGRTSRSGCVRRCSWCHWTPRYWRIHSGVHISLPEDDLK